MALSRNGRRVMSDFWKDVAGYDGLYQVSRNGDVRSFIKWNGTDERMLKRYKSVRGYLVVNLYKRRVRKQTYIHQLVLKTFVGPRPDGMESRHLNDDRLDNRLENLCWGTQSENMLDRTRNGIANSGDHKGVKNQMSKLTNDDVLEIRRFLTEGRLTQGEIGQIFGISSRNVSHIKNRKRWEHVQ